MDVIEKLSMLAKNEEIHDGVNKLADHEYKVELQDENIVAVKI